jgi:hypothetical protein
MNGIQSLNLPHLLISQDFLVVLQKKNFIYLHFFVDSYAPYDKVELVRRSDQKGEYQMAKAQEKKEITVQDQKTKALAEQSRNKLTLLGLNHKNLSDADVINFAKGFCDMEKKIETARQDKLDIAKSLKSELRKRVKKEIPAIVQNIHALAKASIENNPSRSFNATIPADTGTLTISLNCFQDVERPEVKDMSSARQTIGKSLRNMAENFGVKNLLDLMEIEKGTKESCSFSVLNSLKGKKGFNRHPITFEDLKYNVSIGWTDAKEEEEE